MTLKEFKEILYQMLPTCYGLAGAMLPEELQAKQVVIDAMTVVIGHNSELIGSLMEQSQLSQAQRTQFEVLLLHYVYVIGQKRFQHMYDGQKFYYRFKHEKNKLSFYQLGPFDRAILFLKDELDYDYDLIKRVVNYDKGNSFAELLSGARQKFLACQNYRSEQSPRPGSYDHS